MKKWQWLLRLAALAALLSVFYSLPWAIETAPMDPVDRMRGEKPAWEGALSIGIVAGFPTINVSGWLKTQMLQIEKQQKGVLLSARELSPQALAVKAAAAQLPDILLFGAGVIAKPEEMLTAMGETPDVRKVYAQAGAVGEARYACPIAVGGYALLYNRAQLQGLGWNEEMDFDQALSLLKEQPIACPKGAATYPLAALASMAQGYAAIKTQVQPHTLLWADFALEQKQIAYVATQRELKRISTLQNSGKSFASVTYAPSAGVFTDQILLGGVVNPHLTGAKDFDKRGPVAREALFGLLSETAQTQLTVAGLFPVTDVGPIYPDDSALYPLEMSLRGKVLLPDVYQYTALDKTGDSLETARQFLRGMS